MALFVNFFGFPQNELSTGAGVSRGKGSEGVYVDQGTRNYFGYL